jgi:DNA helicase-2/ATP-dependent DNA helicase PcrA
MAVTSPARTPFQLAYQRLNPEQKRAVDTIEGPVLVMAGPGTGKTQVLVTRIANILEQTDTPPNAILALTFTESAAQNMRERLVQLIGQTGYSVRISTFHAFCSEIITSNPEYFPIDRGSEPISELDKYDLIRRLVTELKLQRLQPLGDPYFYIKDSISALSDIKREGVTVGEFQTLVDEAHETIVKQLAEIKTFATAKERRAAGLPTETVLKKSFKASEKNLELARLYAAYEHELRVSKRFDFDDMIGLVITAFKTQELLLSEQQENLQYFLVDEYQDTNAAQDQVLQLIANFWGDQANIFAVGDPNQAIFRFQGASVENMLGFLEQYPTATVITLQQGYRCPQPIYDAAARLISHNHLAGENAQLQSAITKQPTQPSIQAVELPSQIVEVMWVAEKIKTLIAAGTPPEEIAIIYRRNSERVELIEALSKWQIGFEIDGGGNVLDEPVMQQLITLLEVIADVRTANTEVGLIQAMLYDWSGLEKITVMKLARAAYRARRTVGELLESGIELVNKYVVGTEVTAAELAPIKAWYDQLLLWGAQDGQVVLTAWCEQVLKESGFMTWLQKQPDGLYLLLALNALYGQVKSLLATNHDAKLDQLLAALNTMRDHGLAIKIDDVNLRKNKVRLTTAHKAKGQEWEHVFILHCTDKKWGNVRSKKQFRLPETIIKHTTLEAKDENEDERRLFYVAVTRAKSTVWLLYPKSFQTIGRSNDTLPSQFIGELSAEPLLQPVGEAFLDQTEKSLAQLLSPVEPIKKNLAAEKVFFAALLKEYKLSVTALNNYLRDPQQFVLNDLLRVPKAKVSAMSFGSAIHVAFEKAYRLFQAEGALPNIQKILNDFELALQAELLSEADYERRLAQGQEILTNYFSTYAAEKPEPLFIEQPFGSGSHITMLGDIKLSGKIDRIDWLDKSSKKVRVIDYKTGQPQTENEITGLTDTQKFTQRELALPATIRGPYQRQLVFYKLLTELDAQFPYTVTEGMFDFVQPKSDTTTLVRKVFPITDEAVADLKQLITEVMSELRSLQFVETWSLGQSTKNA